jgi:PAS domain-containing protein/DNA-binding NarL/FixJ family response regulator
MIPLTGGNLSGDDFRILLLEEDPVDADLVDRSLRQGSVKFQIERVTTIPETLRASANADLLLFSLSRSISLEHLAKIRAACPWMPVVVMANLDDTVAALKAVREGAQEYLLKGQTSSTLLVRTIRYAIERKRAEEALRYRLEFEKLIATISTHFINISMDQIDRGINRALKAIGEFAGVDRSYLFRFNQNTVSSCYQWERGKDAKALTGIRDFNQREFVWFGEKLKQAETIRVQRIQELPPEAAAARHEFESSDVRSLICIPLIYGGSVVGGLGFESVRFEKEWSEDVVSLLKIAGDMFVNALERKRSEWEIQRTRELLTLYSRATNEVLWDWNLQTNEVWWNENLGRIYGHGGDRASRDWWVEQIHPDDRKEVLGKIETSVQKGAIFSALEYRFRKADGSYTKVLDRGYVVFDFKKKPVRMVGALMELTQRNSTASGSDSITETTA